jgi:hypothetical protein
MQGFLFLDSAPWRKYLKSYSWSLLANLMIFFVAFLNREMPGVQVLFLGYLFTPLQGLFNFLIYIRPRYCAVRREFPRKSRCLSLYHAVWYPLAIRQQNARARKLVNDCQSVEPAASCPASTICIENTADRIGEGSSGIRFEVPEATQSGFNAKKTCECLMQTDTSDPVTSLPPPKVSIDNVADRTGEVPGIRLEEAAKSVLEAEQNCVNIAESDTSNTDL